MAEISKYDLIQITNKEHKWFPAILIVDEVKSFGCQAYIITPDAEGVHEFYIRLETDDYQKVGRSVIIVDETGDYI